MEPTGKGTCKTCGQPCGGWFCGKDCRKDYTNRHSRQGFSELREKRHLAILSDGRLLARTFIECNERNFDCASYMACLSVASTFNWAGFSCGERCPKYESTPMSETDCRLLAALGDLLSRDNPR